jgi:hypothetical protein
VSVDFVAEFVTWKNLAVVPALDESGSLQDRQLRFEFIPQLFISV